MVKQLTYGQTIRHLMWNWYVPYLTLAFIGARQHLIMNPDLPVFALIHLAGTLWVLAVGNHMWTGSWILRPIEF